MFPVPSPVYYGPAFASAMVLQRAAPPAMPVRPARALVGGAVLLLGLALTSSSPGTGRAASHAGQIVAGVHLQGLRPHRPGGMYGRASPLCTDNVDGAT